MNDFRSKRVRRPRRTYARPTATPQAADDPLVLARDGFMYVGGKTMKVDGHDYVYGQMYVEIRIPAKQTHPYPIIMVHGGSMSGTNYTGTPDGREGWAQYFVRQGYAVYVVDQPGRGRSGILTAAYGPLQNSRATIRRRASSRRKSSSCGRRPRCTPSGPAAASPTIRRRCSLPRASCRPSPTSTNSNRWCATR